MRAKWYKWLDRKSVKLANTSLLDTNAHIDFFVNELGLPRDKFRRIFVGTDSNVFYPRDVKKNTDKFLVHFHGHFIPLQGVKYIIQAAKILKNENIEFNIIGNGQTYKVDRELAENLKVQNINFLDSVPYDKLADHINSADICLGIFGDTLKTELVIPNKVFEAIACQKAVITADTKAIRELFNNSLDILLCRCADPQDLADKIRSLKGDQNLKDKIAQNGYRLFREELNEKIITQSLVILLNGLI